jgi:hypothetical protein
MNRNCSIQCENDFEPGGLKHHFQQYQDGEATSSVDEPVAVERGHVVGYP